MEITYIIVGILSAVFTFSVGYSVMGVFRLTKEIKNINEGLMGLNIDIKTSEELLQRAIHENYRELQSNIDENERDIISLLDSRLDKLENKLKGLIPPTNEELIKRIEKIEEESYRLRMNL